MVAMVAVTRLFADEHGHARFEDIEISLTPGDPPPDAMSVSQPWPASAVLFGRGPAGGSHDEQPEHRRQLVFGVSGRVDVTATLRAPDGTILSEPTAFSVRVSPTADWMYWVLGGLAGLVLVIGVVRTVTRRRPSA